MLRYDDHLLLSDLNAGLITPSTVSLLSARQVSGAWKDLFPEVLATYRDGFVVTDKETSPTVTITSSE